MRSVSLPPIVTLAILTLFNGCSAGSQPADSQSEPVPVHIRGMSYGPRMLEVRPGDAVVWINDAHTVHSATSEEADHAFDTGDILPGQTSKPIRFASPGEYQYHCRVHGKAMSGTVVVRADRLLCAGTAPAAVPQSFVACAPPHSGCAAR